MSLMDDRKEESTYKILHLTTHDTGGAGRAAYRLHQNLKRAGHESVLAVLFKNSQNEDVIKVRPGFVFRVFSRLLKPFKKQQKIQALPEYHFYNEAERDTNFNTRDLLNQIPLRPDLIIVHWVS